MHGETGFLHEGAQKRLGFFAEIEILDRASTQTDQLQTKMVSARLGILLQESPPFQRGQDQMSRTLWNRKPSADFGNRETALRMTEALEY